MVLTRNNGIYGGAAIIEGAPDASTHQRALVISGEYSPKTGIFDMLGRRISNGTMCRGIPHYHSMETGDFCDLDPTLVTAQAEPGAYVYAGHIPDHYGHFITSGLVRFWHPAIRGKGVKIVYNGAPVERLFSLDFFRSIMGVLGLDESNFVRFDEPTIVENIVVPAPAFVENIGAYTEFKALCERIGKAIAGEKTDATSPVYFTKARLVSGIIKFSNENEVSDILASDGFEVISPETLSFKEQIDLFHSGRVLCAQSSSVFHTSIFAPASRFISYNNDRMVGSNQIIIDRLNGNLNINLSAADAIEPAEQEPHFHVALRFKDPGAVADDLRKIAKALPSMALPSSYSGPRSVDEENDAINGLL